MTHRAWFIAILSPFLVTLVAFAATAQSPEPLVLADLRVSGVAVDDDSTSVRQRLGAPISVDANVFHYRDLDILLKEDRVAILTITGPSVLLDAGCGWATRLMTPPAVTARAMQTLR